MDARLPDEMTGADAAQAALDRELQAMLDVAPSPAFAARVRARIADEPPAGSWFGAWTLTGSAAAIATVAIVVVGLNWPSTANRPAVALDARRLPTLGAPWAAAGASDAVAVAMRMSSGGAPATAARHAPIHATPPEPEVLVDPREMAAIRALISGTRDGRVDLAAVASAAASPVMDLPPVTEIEIPALTIDPIAPGTGEEGVRQ